MSKKEEFGHSKVIFIIASTPILGFDNLRMLVFPVFFIIGFVAGYGVRSYFSWRKRQNIGDAVADKVPTAGDFTMLPTLQKNSAELFLALKDLK